MRKIIQNTKPRDFVFLAVLVVALVISGLFFRRVFNLILLACVLFTVFYLVYVLIGASIVMHKQKKQ